MIGDLRLQDNIEYMKSLPDGFAELCIADPPYGLDFSNYKRHKGVKRYNKHGKKDWDNATPTDEYFFELFRVSKNQLIFGGNYFMLPPTQCFVFWYKHQPIDDYSDGELIWTSFKRPAKMLDYRSYGSLEGNTAAPPRIHPNQKPIFVYRYLLKEFAKEGDKILDPNLGSFSSAIACDIDGYDIYGCESDPNHFADGMTRYQQHKAQAKLFS